MATVQTGGQAQRKRRQRRTDGGGSGRHNDWRSACGSSPSPAGPGSSAAAPGLVLCALSGPGS